VGVCRRQASSSSGVLLCYCRRYATAARLNHVLLRHGVAGIMTIRTMRNQTKPSLQSPNAQRQSVPEIATASSATHHSTKAVPAALCIWLPLAPCASPNRRTPCNDRTALSTAKTSRLLFGASYLPAYKPTRFPREGPFLSTPTVADCPCVGSI
jgi:hypothetical protein